MKNKCLFLYGLLVWLSSSNLLCSVKPKKIARTAIQKNTDGATSKKIDTRSQERVIIDEIKSLLENGKMPSLSFKEWVDKNGAVLLQSPKEPIQKLGKTLKAIREGDTAKISAFKILPDFEKAVQEYDQKFYISLFSKPVIIAKGTYWYFSSPKNTT